MRNLMMQILRKPDDGTGSAPTDTAPAPDLASALYPNETTPAAETTPPADEQQGQQSEQKADETTTPAGDWKEYVEDPAKTPEENAALKAEHDKTKPQADPLDAVPEDGKYQLVMPEGVELDQALLDEVSPVFKEIGLTHKQAQQVADVVAKVEKQRAIDAQENFAKTTQEWVKEAKVDKEIGGANWNDSLSNAQRFVQAHGTPALRELLDVSGFGNHPEVIRIMAKAGALISEDNPAVSNSNKGKPADIVSTLYPNDKPKG